VGYGRSVLVTVLLSLLVAAGAIGTSAYLRTRSEAQTPPSNSAAAPPATSETCRAEPCQVVATATLGSTRIDLITDAHGARLKIGDDRVVESRLPGRGAKLAERSLDCVAGTLSACLIRGDLDNGTVGEVIVGRSDKWNATTPTYFSNADYLSLVNVMGDGAPELVTVQRGYFAQVFDVEKGNDLGCTANVPKPDRLPGWPTVKPDPHQLRPCQ
jgi:hypothetical protein